MRTGVRFLLLPLWLFLLIQPVLVPATCAQAPGKSYRLPTVDLKQPILWGAELKEPAGQGLAFGGQHQTSDDGDPQTRIWRDGQWRPIHAELLAQHRTGLVQQLLVEAARELKAELAQLRAAWLGGKLTEEKAIPALEQNRQAQFTALAALCEKQAADARANYRDDDRAALRRAAEQLKNLAAGKLPPHTPAPPAAGAPWPTCLLRLHRWQTALEQIAEPLAAQPPQRALSPLAYDAQTGLYVLFGGDHLDYLTADTWVFDPQVSRWTCRTPATAPPPRANHRLVARGDGVVELTGGYAYTSSTDYLGGQYRDQADGTWLYDLAADAWRPAAQQSAGGEAGPAPVAGSPLARAYRTGPLHPDFFLVGPAPDAAAQTERLANLPANTWVALVPPQLPELNRDWGSAGYDPHRGLILRFSGGHSAHGGTDVLHYHTATNRWELPFPVEFPLGQLYTNTEYPEGFNFNRRPWVTGHTYQSYGYEPFTRQMLFTGQPRHTYVWEPDLAEWIGRAEKPRGMAYGSCFYTLTLCTTRRGLYCWTAEGKLFLYDHDHGEWRDLPLAGEKLAGSSVDNSTLVYDSKRDRLYCFRKPYGDQHAYDGRLQAIDCEALSVSTLVPRGAAAAAAIPYLCQIRYDEAHDLLLCGCTFAPGSVPGLVDDPAGLRRTPLYDCAKNEWLSARITGDDPSGPRGRNVSLGLMYDAQRKLFWAVDAKSRVFVLRLAPATADLTPLVAE